MTSRLGAGKPLTFILQCLEYCSCRILANSSVISSKGTSTVRETSYTIVPQPKVFPKKRYHWFFYEPVFSQSLMIEYSLFVFFWFFYKRNCNKPDLHVLLITWYPWQCGRRFKKKINWCFFLQVSSKPSTNFFLKGDFVFFIFSMPYSSPCFICRLLDSTVSEDAGFNSGLCIFTFGLKQLCKTLLRASQLLLIILGKSQLLSYKNSL